MRLILPHDFKEKKKTVDLKRQNIGSCQMHRDGLSRVKMGAGAVDIYHDTVFTEQPLFRGRYDCVTSSLSTEN